MIVLLICLPPPTPVRDKKQTDEDFDKEMQKYNQKLQEMEEKITTGKLRRGYILTGYNSDRMVAVRSFKKEAKNPPVRDRIEILKKQDKRNKEISEEKTVLDVRSYVSRIPFEELVKGKITCYEEDLLYHALFMDLNTEQQKVIVPGDYSYLSYENSWNAVKKFGKDERAYVLRKTLLNKVAGHLSLSFNAKLFFDWLEEYEPGKLAKIQKPHDATYQKREKKIDEQVKQIEETVSENK
ncbi:MAG: hypothetical protein LIP01_02110 [Tannerellaceae bacterium]|nr:hypothetical protein [Tannerellaceae bacterium]